MSSVDSQMIHKHRGKLSYINATNLTDDFRRLRSETPGDLDYSWEVDNCPICLDIHENPKTLACKHTFCKLCLQYTIDRTSSDKKHDDRGFECVICGYFTKMVNYSIPRCDWADNIPADFRFPEAIQDAYNNEKADAESKQTRKGRLKEDNWFVIWNISTFPKSYLLNRGLNPFKRLRNCYVFANPVTSEDTQAREGREEKGETREMSDGQTELHSEILAVTFYGDSVIVYDEGLQEIQLYNKEMTLESTFKEKGVFDFAVLENALYMTVPDDKCINVYDLLGKSHRDPLYLTSKCFGIDTFNDNLAVLLCDENDQKYQVCLVRSTGICGDIIDLKGGRLQFKCPRELAMCPITRLVYVGDEEAGLVKCFRLDGHLSWERLVFGAGALSVYNGYLMVGREYTSSVDVLVSGGRFNGRLQSLKYELFEPHGLSVSTDLSSIVVVDGNNMIHLFSIYKRDEFIIQQKTACCLIV